MQIVIVPKDDKRPWISASFFWNQVAVGESNSIRTSTNNADELFIECGPPTNLGRTALPVGEHYHSFYATEEQIGVTTCTFTAQGPGGRSQINAYLTVVGDKPPPYYP